MLLDMLEAMLFASGEPVTAERLAAAGGLSVPVAEELLEELQTRLNQQGGLVLLRLEDSWQLATKPAYGEAVSALLQTRRSAPLTQAALEVLAILAYHQPVSRGYIEQVRGTDSSSTVASLVEKGLVEEAGRLELPGRPIVYRTTDTFLRVFGLGSLGELPPLDSIGSGEHSLPDSDESALT